MASEIAPCPFPECGGKCGVNAIVMAYIQCESCGARGGDYCTEADAIAAHNALADDVALGRAVRGLPEGYMLRHYYTSSKEQLWALWRDRSILAQGPTPDAALAAFAERVGRGE